VLPSAFLFSSNVFPKDSSVFSISCLDVLLISFDFILPMFKGTNLGLKVFRDEIYYSEVILICRLVCQFL
jgi:hypothetical protein